NYSQNNIVVSDSWSFSPNLLNEVRVSYALNDYVQDPLIQTSWSDLGSKLVLGSQPPQPPQVFLTGYFQSGNFAHNDMPQRTNMVADTVTWIHGAHSIKMGGSFQWNRFREQGNWLGEGQVRFTGSFTKDAFADFLLGSANSFRQNSGLNRDFRS